MKFGTSQPGKQTIAMHILSNIWRSKDNQTVKFGQLIGKVVILSGMSGKLLASWENLPKSQECVRKLDKYLVVSGEYQELPMMY